MPETDGKLPRFHAPNLSVSRVELSEGESHHAAHVLRLKAGAPVELFDGRGASAVGRIAGVLHGRAEVQVEHRLPPRPRPVPAVHLAFAVPKGRRLDWLLEKAAELGAASLRPVVFERSVAGGEEMTAAARDRWLAHCVAAAKQSGLDWLPELHAPLPLAKTLETLKDCLGLVGEAGPTAGSLVQALARRRKGQDVAILVGPEGGLADAERALALDAGFLPVRLGATTLRVETAALALLAAARAISE